jgi:hypothetical protein
LHLVFERAGLLHIFQELNLSINKKPVFAS